MRLFPPAALPGRGPDRRSGQTIIFAIMVLVVIFFIVLWNFDLHKIIYVKTLSQNGGDAAAVGAARWQAQSLNLVGDLNIAKALALTAGDRRTATSIEGVQARLAIVGPMVAFFAAQQAAKNNKVYQNDDFTRLIREHADRVRNEYATVLGPGGTLLFPEPYPGAWLEYADMLDYIASEGVAAGPENARFFTDPGDGHILLMRAFYEAVAGQNWCWFHNNAPDLLPNYTDYLWWPPLPPMPPSQFINAEIFGLGLTRVLAQGRAVVNRQFMNEVAAERGFAGRVGRRGIDTVTTWYCYGPGWGAWDVMATAVDSGFPITGPLKPEFNYSGADAAVRVESEVRRFTPGPGGTNESRTIAWTAAAKPFGYLTDRRTSERLRPNLFRLILPAFHEARLIPLDASSAPDGGGFNLEWRRHVEVHLPDYLAHGPPAYACWYCSQLHTWENPAFRAIGIAWLAANSHLCVVTGGGGGGGGGGGSRRGH